MTHILDEPITHSLPTFLADPLIPIPLENINMLEDIYSVGPSSSERWRIYIDCKDWDPKKYNDKLLQKRAYHARHVWEIITLIAMCDDGWLTIDVLRMIRNGAFLELRLVEIELMSFQLTCGNIGITTKKDKHAELYRCACTMFLTCLFMANKILDNKGKKRTKEQRKLYLELQDEKPLQVDSTKTLASTINKGIYTLHQFTQKGTLLLNDEKKMSDLMLTLSTKLKECIISFDDVAVIIP